MATPTLLTSPIPLLQNLAVIVVVAFLFGQILPLVERLSAVARQCVCGLLFGGLALACMSLPLHAAPGVIVDLRNVAVMATAPFCGPLAGLLSAGMAAAFRLHLGGAGLVPAMAELFGAVVIGQVLASHRMFAQARGGHAPEEAERSPARAFHAALAGLMLGLVSLATLALLPDRAEAERLLWTVGPVMLAFYPVATTVIWLLLRSETRRHAAQLALQASEARFRDVAEAATDWFWEMGPDLRISYVSPRFGEVTGVDPRSLIGLSRREMWSGDGSPDMVAHEAGLRARESFRDFAYRIRLADGSRRHISVNGKPIYDEHGRFAGYRGSGRDITAEVEARERMLEAQREAEFANQAKSAFLAQMSHELRTPLNAILGFSEVMRNEMFGPLGADNYRDYLGHIHESGEHLLQLINDMLDLSKVEAGRYELAVERCRPDELVDAAMRLVGQSAEARGVQLRQTVPAGLPDIEVDPRLMRQVLLNLMSNGVKFTEAGGEVALSVRTLADGGLEIVVADTGIGMDQQDSQLVLQPFVQAKGRPRHIEGTGLGLALAKGFVELHGGRLTLESRRGVGTTVRIQLPASRLLPSPDAERPARRADRAST